MPRCSTNILYLLETNSIFLSLMMKDFFAIRFCVWIFNLQKFSPSCGWMLKTENILHVDVIKIFSVLIILVVFALNCFISLVGLLAFCSRIMYCPWDQGHIGITLGTKHYVKKLVGKRRSMSTDLKVSSLVCKCAIHKSEHNVKGNLMEPNFQGLEMQK